MMAREEFPVLVRLQQFCREDLDFYLLSEGYTYAFTAELDRIFLELDIARGNKKRPEPYDPYPFAKNEQTFSY